MYQREHLATSPEFCCREQRHASGLSFRGHSSSKLSAEWKPVDWPQIVQRLIQYQSERVGHPGSSLLSDKWTDSKPASAGRVRRGSPPVLNRPGRWIVILLILLVVLELTYLLAANLILASTWFHEWINKGPEHFYMRWSGAQSWVPGVVHVQGVSLSGRNSTELWYGSIDDCTFSIHLSQLLFRKVQCNRLSASGVEFRLRQEGLLRQGKAHRGQPTIPPLLAPESPGDSPSEGRSWRVNVDVVSLLDVRDLWIGGFRVAGSGDLLGRVSFVTKGDFEARLDGWNVPSGRMEIAGVPVSTNVQLRLKGNLGPLVFAESRGDALFDRLDAYLEIQGETLDLESLTGRVDPSRSIRLNGTGIVNASVHVLNGMYWPGSILEIQSPQLILTTGDYSWRGPARLIDRIELDEQGRARARLELEETEFELWYQDQAIVGARGPKFALQSTAHDLRLVRRFADADLHLQVSPMVIPDASVLNRQLPKPMSKFFKSGNVTATLQLERGMGRAIHGTLHLAGDDLTVYANSAERRVDARLQVRFAADSDLRGRFDLAGTSLELTDLSVPKFSTRRLEPWTASLEMGQASLHVQEPWALHGQVELTMQDTSPVVAVLRSFPGAPRWLRWLPSLKTLHGNTRVSASAESVSFHQMDFQARGAEIRGQLDLLDEAANGILYFRYGLISLGLELLARERDWHLLGAKHWYERRLREAQSTTEP